MGQEETKLNLSVEEVIALERCLADRDAEEAFRILKALAEKIRHAQATA